MRPTIDGYLRFGYVGKKERWHIVGNGDPKGVYNKDTNYLCGILVVYCEGYCSYLPSCDEYEQYTHTTNKEKIDINSVNIFVLMQITVYAYLRPKSKNKKAHDKSDIFLLGVNINNTPRQWRTYFIKRVKVIDAKKKRNMANWDRIQKDFCLQFTYI